MVAKSRRQTAATSAESSDAPTKRSLRRLRWLVPLLLALLVAWGVIWYRERPLRAAERAFAAGDMQTAFAELSTYLDRSPNSSRGLALKARMLVDLGSPAEAITLFERVGPASAADIHAWAKAHLMREEWSEALPLLIEVVRMEPQNADALYETTACQMRLGYYEAALTSAEQYLASGNGQQARAYVFLGSIHNDLGNREAAALAYAKVLEHDPEAKTLQVAPQDFFAEYAGTLVQLSRLDEAREVASRSLAANPTADAATLLGNIYAQSGQAEAAEHSWQQALTLDPGHIGAREALATAALARGDGPQALEWLQPLEQQAGLVGSTAYLFQRAYTLLKDEAKAAEWSRRTAQLRESERIIQAIDSVLVDAPQSFWARVIRAYRFAQSGNWNQAEVMLGQLREEAPNEPFVAELADALETRGALPPLTKLPLVQK